MTDKAKQKRDLRIRRHTRVRKLVQGTEARPRLAVFRSNRHIVAQIIGVTDGYSKGLEIVGTGYRVQAKGSSVEFALGYSHSITVDPPAGISFEVEGNNKLHVRGIDKQAVGEVAANIRKLRKPEPYKGKGVRYAGEVVRRKAGKSGK